MTVRRLRTAWLGADVLHLGGATHPVLTLRGDRPGDLIGDRAKRVGIA